MSDHITPTATLLDREVALAKEKAVRIAELFAERDQCEQRIKAIAEELKALGYKRARTRKAKVAAQ